MEHLEEIKEICAKKGGMCILTDPKLFDGICVQVDEYYVHLRHSIRSRVFLNKDEILKLRDCLNAYIQQNPDNDTGVLTHLKT